MLGRGSDRLVLRRVVRKISVRKGIRGVSKIIYKKMFLWFWSNTDNCFIVVDFLSLKPHQVPI